MREGEPCVGSVYGLEENPLAHVVGVDVSYAVVEHVSLVVVG